MSFKIHFEYADGTEDSIIVHGETIEEIRAMAGQELHKRGGLNPWSEEVKQP